jgi:hypothetical protein
MPRLIGLAGAAIIGSQLLCAGVMASPTTEPRRDGPAHAPAHNFVEPAGTSVAAHHVRRTRRLEVARAAAARATARAAESVPPVPPADAAGADPTAAQPPGTGTQPPGDGDVITPWQIMTRQEIRVSHIAWLNGDRKYLMVDKALGKILLFEDGRPIYIARALTGESLSDQVLPEEIAGKMADLNALKYKVTPAGRFTISRHYDPHYGYLFDINEVHGKDWSIALHRVYLGTPSEHREERLASPREDDKNISFGCINVTPETEAYLLTQLPENGTPLYVLPRDKEETQAAFSRDDTFAIAASDPATDRPVASSPAVASAPAIASSPAPASSPAWNTPVVASSPVVANSPASNAPVLFSAVSASTTSAAATMGSPTPDPRQNVGQISAGQLRSTP